MSSSNRQQLRQATEAAWKSARSETPGSRSAPRPGDVFAPPETSHLAVEWAVIEHDPASRRLYAVPADTWRQIGSHDVHIDADAACGPLSLRCGLGLWLSPESFDPELRSGVLDRADLDRARRTWRSIESDTVEPSQAQRETATELEYRDWIENGPAQARALLAGSSVEHPATEADALPETDAGRYLALAASLILAMTLAAAGTMLWWRLSNTGQATDPLTVTLIRTRGVKEISLPPDVQALELRLGDFYPEPYRVEVRSEDPPRTIRTFEQSPLILPKRALPAGEYRIVVLALRNGREKLLGDYRIDIEHLEHEPPP